MATVIRVERGSEVKGRPGVFPYRATARGVEISGLSRTPLLDACRQIKPLLSDTAGVSCAIYREGMAEADLTCGLDWGAAHSVREEPNVAFQSYRPFHAKGS
jgi:hypothetical protein